MYSPIIYERQGSSFPYTRPLERSLLDILLTLVMAAIIAAITFIPLAAAGNGWFL